MKKKLIAGMTSAAVIASLSAPAFAANFGDVKGTNAEQATALLKALGVVNGDVNGNFNPSATITRAEFAKIAVKVAGLGAAADAYGTGAATGFNDVPAGHWAAGYVAVAKAAGLVKGYDAWNFGPTDNVRYEDVLTVVERILGYNDNLVGGYSAGYVVKGAQLGLVNNTSFATGKAATRGDVAVIAAAATDKFVVSYDKDTNTFTEKTKKLIASSFSQSVLSVQLKDVKTLSGTSLTVDGQLKYGTNGVTTDDKVATFDADTVVVGGSLEALVGRDVNVVQDSNGKVIYIADATQSSKVVTGKLSGAVASTTVSLDGVTTPYTIASNAVYLLNGGLVSSLNNQGVKGDSVKLVLNSAGQVEAVAVTHYEAPIIATGAYSPKTAVTPALINNSEKVADNAQVTLNGAPATLADIQKDDVISVAKVNGSATIVEIARKPVTGTLTGYVSPDGAAVTSVTVGGTSYTVRTTSPYVQVGDVTPLLNATAQILLDKDGKVAKIQAPASTATSNVIFIKSVAQGVYVVDPATNVATAYDKITYVGLDNVEKTAFVALNSAGTGPNQDFSGVVNALWSVNFDSTGKIKTGAAAVPAIDGPTADVNATVGTASGDVNATTKSVKIGGNTYYVTNTTAIFDGGSKKFVGFDALAGGQNVDVTFSATNTLNPTVIKINSLATASVATGVYVEYKRVTDANNSTKHYVTLNVNGVNTDYQVKDGSLTQATVGDLATLTDDNASTSGYDVIAQGTAATQLTSNSGIANGFNVVGDASNKYVVDASTKIYVVKYDTTNTPDKRDAATVGSLSDVTGLFDKAPGNYQFQLHVSSTTTFGGGFKYVDSVVVYLQK